MKKRILLLVPCLLLVLGLLTACGSNGGGQSDKAVEQKLISATWEGKAEDFSGLVSIGLPFHNSNLVTIKFDSDTNNKTGYISVLDQRMNFTWNVKGNKIVLKFGNIIHIPLDYTFSLDDNSLTLTGIGVDINLKH